ncbi:hypothetical protein [Mesorhizobium sp. M0159]|uniref:hypothetical protein n=1 Tax=Mesorhizobium sp. M0159 TaxID=2956900 RepID=UPI00333540EF
MVGDKDLATIHLPAIVWNNIATTFTALKVNVTDRASAAGSRLADFQIGSVSMLTISKTGSVRGWSTTTAGTPSFFYRGTSGSANGIFSSVDGMLGFSATGIERGRVNSTGFLTHLAYQFSATAGAAVDLGLARDAASLAQRNGANAHNIRPWSTARSYAKRWSDDDVGGRQ